MGLDEMLCTEKHKRVDEKLIHHESWLGDHERKIDRLDRSDATNTQCIIDLCGQIGNQTKAIWGLVTAIASVGVGFFIWYVQNIGGKTP